jgi:di/tricarboxylate transporter
MPMAFGSLLGGTVTLIGTSPNIIVSRVRQELTGQPFGMFDFAFVGVALAIVGVLFLSVGYRLLPRGRKGQASMDVAFDLEGYTTEVLVTKESAIIDKTVGDFKKLFENQVDVLMILRDHSRRYDPPDNARFKADDILLLEGEPEALERVVEAALSCDKEEWRQIRRGTILSW